MNYELDFVGVPNAKKDADAIGLRWRNDKGQYVAGVYDGGFEEHAKQLSEIIDKYYFENASLSVLDFVICSHSDEDHASGLRYILENIAVKNLYINLPWLYIDELWPYVNDGRITKNSFEKQLREQYKYLDDIEKIACNKGVQIHPTFTGDIIEERLTVLSPTKGFYLKQLIASSKTPLDEKNVLEDKGLLVTIVEKPQTVCEYWGMETLREDVSTTPENETSIVILGEFSKNSFLLVADAGIQALNNSITYLESEGYDFIGNVNFYQIPHHGSRHNVSSSLLNRMIGKPVEEGAKSGKIAIASVAKNSDHPRKMVVNAFIRRGVIVYKTKGCNHWHHIGVQDRKEYNSSIPEQFSTTVEKWD